MHQLLPLKTVEDATDGSRSAGFGASRFALRGPRLVSIRGSPRATTAGAIAIPEVKPWRDFFARVSEVPADQFCTWAIESTTTSPALRTAFLRRGPWAYAHADRTKAETADLRLNSLHELAELIASTPNVR